MRTHHHVEKAEAERGPRYLVCGTVRSGEFRFDYSRTLADAERIEEEYHNSGNYQVTIIPPERPVDTEAIRQQIDQAQRAMAEALNLGAAAAHRLAEDEVPEAAIARQLGVDRMTVRKWLGK